MSKKSWQNYQKIPIFEETDPDDFDENIQMDAPHPISSTTRV